MNDEKQKLLTQIAPELHRLELGKLEIILGWINKTKIDGLKKGDIVRIKAGYGKPGLPELVEVPVVRTWQDEMVIVEYEGNEHPVHILGVELVEQ